MNFLGTNNILKRNTPPFIYLLKAEKQIVYQRLSSTYRKMPLQKILANLELSNKIKDTTYFWKDIKSWIVFFPPGSRLIMKTFRRRWWRFWSKNVLFNIQLARTKKMNWSMFQIANKCGAIYFSSMKILINQSTFCTENFYCQAEYDSSKYCKNSWSRIFFGFKFC